MAKEYYLLHYGVAFHQKTKRFENLVEAKQFISSHVFENDRYTYLEKVEKMEGVPFKIVPVTVVSDLDVKRKLSTTGCVAKSALDVTPEVAQVSISGIIDFVLEGNSISEAVASNKAVVELGYALDKIYNQFGEMEIAGIKLTPSEVSELLSIYLSIVKDHASYSSITTISQKVHDVLKALGFNVKEQGVGWVLSEGQSRYGFDDLPDWAKPIVKDEFGERQRYLDLYCDRNFVELTYSEGGDIMKFRVYPDGTVTQR